MHRENNLTIDTVVTTLYVLHTFHATVEGQVSVERDDHLKLLDDSNSYWWLIKVLKSDDIGYIPAEKPKITKEKNVSFNTPLFVFAEEPEDEFDEEESFEDCEGEYEESIENTAESVDEELNSEISNNEKINQQISDATPEIVNSVQNVTSDITQVVNSIPNSVKTIQNDNSTSEITQVVVEPEFNPPPTQVINSEPDPVLQQVVSFPAGTDKETPSLGSDFIDFSDEEEEERRFSNKANKFFGTDSSKFNISHEESRNSMDDKDEKRGSKSKKEKKEGGRFMNFFKRKSKKKDEDISPLPSQNSSNVLPKNKLKSGSSPIKIVQQHNQTEISNSNSPVYSILRIFAGKNILNTEESKILLLSPNTSVNNLIRQTLIRFKLNPDENWNDYYITVKESDGGQIQLMPNDNPLEIFNSLISSSSVPLPTVNRNSISSISSTLSIHEAIKASDSQNDANNSVCFFLNKKSKRGSRVAGEKKIRVRVLLYADDLPDHLRNKQVPRTSMSVPKHLAEKAARRRSCEEGKPKEKSVILSINATVRNTIEKAMDKFGIIEYGIDDFEKIPEIDEIPRYQLMMIVDGEEKLLHPTIILSSIFPSNQDPQHLSIDSLDSSFSFSLDSRVDIVTSIGAIRSSRVFSSKASKVRYSFIPTKGEEIDISDLIEDIWDNDEMLVTLNEGSEPIRSSMDSFKNSNQQSKMLALKNKKENRKSKTQDLDVLEKIVDNVQNNDSEAVQSLEERIGRVLNKVKTGKFGTDSISNVATTLRNLRKEENHMEGYITNESLIEISNPVSRTSPPISPESNHRTESFSSSRSSSSISAIQSDSDYSVESSLRIIPSLIIEEEEQESQLPYNSHNPHNSNNSYNSHSSYNSYSSYNSCISYDSNINSNININSININSVNIDSTNINSTNINSNINSTNISSNIDLTNINSNNRDPFKTRQRSESTTSNNSIKSYNSGNSTLNTSNISTPTQEAMPLTPPGIMPGRKQSTTSIESDWILSNDFGLQELIILARSEINILESKERSWLLINDPEKIFDMIETLEIREEVKEVFGGVNNELDKLEEELNQILDDAIRVF
ncbi:7258_t:CDS:2 [Diversispora eburnea]|uniref:7258_t:CDS:1 n=1 Tax=Diversispora eburnea TaxID=1213867 RepID=A0A9N8UYU7_9GLOM|nr:7258_t:CDS:2 [Diversispora eburnea]